MTSVIAKKKCFYLLSNFLYSTSWAPKRHGVRGNSALLSFSMDLGELITHYLMC